MDTISRFANDLVSWYWWLSVVVVGILINLISSYLKSPLDSWMSKRSEKSRLQSKARRDAFESEARRIASDPALLALASQAAIAAESRTRSIFTVIGVNLTLIFVIDLGKDKSAMSAFLSVSLTVAIVMYLINLFAAMRGEEKSESLFKRARQLYVEERPAPPKQPSEA